jgi:hypothetical protein
LVFAVPASGQRKLDIGFMAAVPWYFGDLAPDVPQSLYFPPAIGPIVRYNFNMRNSLRAHMVLYELSGSGEIFGGTAADFQSSFVDLGLDFEFNWWPYKTDHRKTKFSPYVTAGLGYGLNVSNEGKSHLYLPFGGGVKANLWRKLSGGVEVSVRKTFNDNIDGVYNTGTEGVSTPLANTDWYMFTGIFLTYKIFNYNEDCPTYNERTYSLNNSGTSSKKDSWFTRTHGESATSKSKGSRRSKRKIK